MFSNASMIDHETLFFRDWLTVQPVNTSVAVIVMAYSPFNV